MKKKFKPSRKNRKRLKKLMRAYLSARAHRYGTAFEDVLDRDGKPFLVDVNFSHRRIDLL